jgi:hypothetical protein
MGLAVCMFGVSAVMCVRTISLSTFHFHIFFSFCKWAVKDERLFLDHLVHAPFLSNCRQSLGVVGWFLPLLFLCYYSAPLYED